MTQGVIQAEGIGKRYIIGTGGRYLPSLREKLTETLTSPWRFFRSNGQNPREYIWALQNISFDVREGEVLGLIGRNGSGKSTLLKILSRITRPTVGHALIQGRVASLLEVGTGFHPELTGRENVYLNGAILGMTKAEIRRKFDEIIAFAEIERFLDTPVKHYSSGMYVRLAFAVAAHLDPDILLVDEVLAVGDLSFQRKCAAKMQQVSRGGRTIIFISHQMNQIRRLCQRGLWIDAGRVREQGPTEDVVNAYEAAMSSGEERQTSYGAVRSSVAQFVGWEILGSNGGNPHKLSSLGPTKIRFLLDVNQPVQHGVHGITLYTVDRRIVWGWAKYDLHLSQGTTEFVYEFPMLPLKPGKYSWMVSLWDDDGLIDIQDVAPEMLVSTPWHQHPREEWSGILNMPSQFVARMCDKPVARSVEEAPPEMLGL